MYVSRYTGPKLTRRRRSALWVWGPSLALMIVLFITSAQPKYDLPDATTPVYFSGMIPIFHGLLDTLIKKGAHIVVYGALALLNLRALMLSFPGASTRRAGYLAIVLTVLYAVSDELHQAFVPGRSASGLDVGFDFLGAVLCILAARRYKPNASDDDAAT